MSKKPITNKAAIKGTSTSPDVRELEKILELMGRHSVAELKWGNGTTRLHLRTQASFVAAPVMMSAPSQAHYAPAAAPQATAPAAASGPAAPPALAANTKQILSPFVGTFYRSSSPGGAPYVKEGQSIKPGDALCIIEAMKLMNEIEAEHTGKILSVLVENGHPVEFGEPLFLIET